MNRAARRAESRIGQLSGVARPTPMMRHLALTLHGPKMAESIDSMLEDAVAVNALATAMDRAMVAGTNASGNVDMREAAMHLIKEMRRSQK